VLLAARSFVLIVVRLPEMVFLVIVHGFAREGAIVDMTAADHLVHLVDEVGYVVGYQRAGIGCPAMLAVLRRVIAEVERILRDILRLALIELLAILFARLIGKTVVPVHFSFL
jgi:hypothetical protein